jgi:NAD(P)-dependent dehydrogenase (short-subunit alcohol dehydrogenase family)
MITNEKQLGKLDGKVALITGGNSGIGLATAKRFVNEGAYVFSAGRRKSELDAAVKEMGKNVTAVQGDVANFDDLVDSSLKAKGQARYLVRQHRNRQGRAAWHDHRRVV